MPLTDEGKELVFRSNIFNDEMINDLFKGLKVLYNVQQIVSGIQPESLDGSRQTILNYMFALNEEVHELGREIGIKPWKNKKEDIDHEAVMKEFSDILAFLGILLININHYLYQHKNTFLTELVNQYHLTSFENLSRLQDKNKY